MLDMQQRYQRYTAQTGRRDITPRQRRRMFHKVSHQHPESVAAREAKAVQRAKVRESRKQRLAGLLGR